MTFTAARSTHTSSTVNQELSPFHIMAKPSGPLCNLDCRYCFYVGKTDEYESQHTFRMSDEVLETYIRDYCASQPGPEIAFAWQGGEPTLMGLDFFAESLNCKRNTALLANTAVMRYKPTALALTRSGASF